MKHNFFQPFKWKFLLIIFLKTSIVLAQPEWEQLNNFSGTPRLGAVAATVGEKAYIGIGEDETQLTTDWWSYDPATDTWTQKADFPGTARKYAVAFSIADTIYVGTGQSGAWNAPVYHSDFYKYDPVLNAWDPIAGPQDGERCLAVAAVADGKGYMGTGKNSSGQLKDWWSYNPATGKWEQKTDLVSDKRQSAVAFALNEKIYLGAGQYVDGGTFVTNDLYEYDPVLDSWKEKSFAESHLAVTDAAAFVIGDTAYVVGGSGSNSTWKYNAESNTWTEGPEFGLSSESNRTNAVAFAIEGKGYVGTGSYFNVGTFTDVYKGDLWVFDPDPELPPTTPGRLYNDSVSYNYVKFSWVDKADNELGYIVKKRVYTGSTSIEVLTDTLPANATSYEDRDVLENTEYEYTVRAFNDAGNSGSLYFYPHTTKYLKDPDRLRVATVSQSSLKLSWRDNSDKEDGYLVELSANDTTNFSVLDSLAANQTYFLADGLVSGTVYFFRISAFVEDSLQSDFTDYISGVPGKLGSWKKVGELESKQKDSWTSFSFSLSGKFYYGGGYDDSWNYSKEQWQFDPETKTWTQVADAPIVSGGTNSLSIGDKGYLISGENTEAEDDNYYNTRLVYEYNSKTNKWTKKPDFPGLGRTNAATFSISGKGYLVGGDTVYATSGDVQTNELWELDTASGVWTQKADFGGGNREGLAAFVIDGTAYVGLGEAYYGKDIKGVWTYYLMYNDFWKYDPVADSWSQVADFPGMNRRYTAAFSDGTSGYIGGGTDQYYEITHDFWKYDYTADQWMPIAPIPEQVMEIYESADYGLNLAGSVMNFSNQRSINYGIKRSVFEFGSDLPSPVNDLSVEIEIPDSVYLVWTDVDDDENGYFVERKIKYQDNDFVRIDTIAANTTSYTDYDLPFKQEIFYRLIRYSNGKVSQASNEAKATIPGPPDGTNFTLSTPDSSHVNLEWTFVDHSDGFILERSLQLDAGFVEIESFSPNQLSYTDSEVSSNTKYYYRIKSYNSYGPTYSFTKTITTPGKPNSVPEISWCMFSSDYSTIQGFVDTKGYPYDGIVLQRSVNKNDFETQDTLSLMQLNFNDLIDGSNEVFSYRVMGYNKYGNTGWSEIKNLYNFKIPDVSAEVVNNHSLLLSWNNLSEFDDHYYILIYGAQTSEQKTIELDPGVYEYTIDFTEELPANESFEIALGCSYLGDVARRQITLDNFNYLRQPTDLDFSIVTTGEIRLHWTDASNLESGYRIILKEGTAPEETIATIHEDAEESTVFISEFPETFTLSVEAFNSDLGIISERATLQINKSTDVVTGLDDHDLPVKVYPNPMIDELQIESNVKSKRFELIDAGGKVIMNGLLNNRKTTVPVQKLKKGIYFLKLEDEEGINIFKLIK